MTMTNKNTHDRQRELRIMNSQARFITMDTVGGVRRRGRQLLREWAVSGRRAFGTKSIEAYCDYISNNNLIDLH